MNQCRPTRVVHLELHTHDLAGASAFYCELLGWRSVLTTREGGEIALWQPKSIS